MLCFVGDVFFSLGVSVLVVFVDKLDIFVGIFGIGQLFKGDKDLFVFCCVVIGVLCIVIELLLLLDFEMLVSKVINVYGDKLMNVEI